MTFKRPADDPIPPMSRHHVLHAMTELADLPSHLVRPFLLLAGAADHRTGLARPGRTIINKRWGIPYSTWHRNIQQLAERGLVKQIKFGHDKTGTAAEYLLLHVAPVPADGTPSRSGEGGLEVQLKESPFPGNHGRGPTSGKPKPESPAPDGYEAMEWASIRNAIFKSLSAGEQAKLEGEVPDFDQMAGLRRAAVRLAALGQRELVIEELTRSRSPGKPAYAGARMILPAMWARLAPLARTWGVAMNDASPVEPPPDLASAARALSERIPGFDVLGLVG